MKDDNLNTWKQGKKNSKHREEHEHRNINRNILGISEIEQRPKCKSLNYKVLEEHTAEKLHDTGFGSFLSMIPKAQATKEKVEKLDYIKN